MGDGESIRVEIRGRLGVGIQGLDLRSSFEFRVEKTVVGWVILFYLIVDGGWVWVILGLCWVYSSTEKTMVGWG